ncbi:PST family polysaccharide transporter [Microbacterium sp. SLBN-154]|uniref:lipopolysaccharide biosynthesis protein n=1 Tax=Microbacterium sp. SLBN-154 TaxID=2768458 RepID=UPI00115278F9|nr:lipopolysaccharide biosynthesis protein [Microbacterium sp. SLBN-154]TQK18630.1 PST family polysaccharide transporter [Microbacterium sp. SLBN-154]
MTSLASAAARGGASTVIFQLIRMVIGLGTMVIVARLLNPADFGLFAMIIAIVGLAEILRDFGFMNAVSRAPSLSRRQASNLFWMNTGLGLFIGVALFLSSSLLATFYSEPRLGPLAQALALVFAVNGVSVQFKAHLVRGLKITRVNIAETFAQLFGSVVVIVLAILGLGYWALFWQQLAVAVSALAMLIVFSGWFPGLPAKAPMGSFLSYGAAVAGQQTLNYAVRNVDTVAIGRFLGAVTLGFYDRAYQLLMIPIGQFNAPLTRVAVPTLARVWNGGGPFERYLHTAQKVAAFVTVPFFALMIALGEVGVSVVYGEKWGFSGVILQILAVGGVFRSLMQITYWAYLSSGRAGTMLRFDLIALPVLALTILGGLPWGVLGVAAAHSVGYAAYWLVGLWWMTRKLKVAFRPLFVTGMKSIAVAVLVVAVGLASTALITNDLVALLAGLGAALVAIGLAVGLVPGIRNEYATVLRVARMALGRRRP